MERSEPVFPGSRRRIKADQIVDASQLRYVTHATLNTPKLHRNPSYVKELDFTNDGPQSKSHYQMVLSGRDDPKESDVDTDIESASVSTVDCGTEEIQLDRLNTHDQDSDEIDNDFSSLNSSLTHCPVTPVFGTQPCEEDNEGVTFMMQVEESDVKMTVEETHRETNNVSVVTAEPTECEDKSFDMPVALVMSKAVQNTIPPQPPEQKQEDVAKVLFVSKDWKAEFPLDEWVSVKHDEEVHALNGSFETPVYNKVKQVNHQLLSNLKQLDTSPHTSIVVAYLEDDEFGYIVKEYLESLATVVKWIIDREETVTKDLTKIDRIKSHTADSMSLRRFKLNKQKHLKQLLSNLVTGLIDANECLHQRGLVSLNLQLNNFLVRFNCECWGKPSCSHGSSAVTVVIRDCELAYPVGSVVDQLTNSKALKLLDSMHKYKRAEVDYDDHDLAVCIIELLTMISGNKDCREKLSAWTHNIGEGVFTDPPVVEIQQLCKECGVPQIYASKIIDYLKVSASHYARLYGEHEV